MQPEMSSGGEVGRDRASGGSGTPARPRPGSSGASGGAVPPDPIDWLSTREAARRLGITTRTLYRLIDSGQVPAYRFGRVIRLQAAEVDAFIAAARIRPGELEHLYADAGSEADTTDGDELEP
jgi:excisionase family DNA binding protein